MTKKFIELDRPIIEMSAAELRSRLGDVPKSILMRSIILNERDFIRVDYDRSLRALWYSTVKPTLEKLGLLAEQDTTEESLCRWDAELSRYMADLVRMGILTYQDLRVVDNSRRRENPVSRYRVADLNTFGYQVAAAPYPGIILATEKDTVYTLLEAMASLYGCSCISGKGQNSLGAMEGLLRGIPEDVSYYYILTMTDYDPAGYYIAQTFANQARDILQALDRPGIVELERVGITPEQLTTEQVEANKYTPKRAGRQKWFEQTGGINGEQKGLELDALHPDRIREIFVTTLKKYINPKEYRRFIKRAYIRRQALEAIQPKIQDVLRETERREIDLVEILDFDMGDLAVEGFNELPIEKLCIHGRDTAIINTALELLSA